MDIPSKEFQALVSLIISLALASIRPSESDAVYVDLATRAV